MCLPSPSEKEYFEDTLMRDESHPLALPDDQVEF